MVLELVQDFGSLILEDGEVIELSLKKECLSGDSLEAGVRGDLRLPSFGRG